MNTPRESSDDWACLLVGLVDTDLTPDELVALRHELRQDGAVDAYVDYISLHALLEWRFGTPQLTDVESQAAPTAEPAATRSIPSTSPLLGFLSGAWDLVQGSPRALLMILVGLLAGYFVTVMALVPLARRAEQNRIERGELARQPAAVSPPGTDVGALEADDRARWSRDSSPSRGGRLRAGECYRLASGSVQMALAGGVRVWIDGPAEFEPQSGERVHLLRGKLSAQVPPAGRGFTVATPSAEVIDLGTEFGVEVDGSGKTDIHVLLGEVEVKPVSDSPASLAPREAAGSTKVVAGQAVRVSAGERPMRIPVDRRAFAKALSRPATVASADRPSDPMVTKIWLGNLFDDKPRTPLAAAMRTDTFKASPTFSNTLGVDRVIYGGPALLEVAPGVRLDLTNLGWTGEDGRHRIANDAWSHNEIYVRNGQPAGGVRLSGKPMGLDEPKMEEAIGMHANALLTFDLDEIRTAGRLDAQAFDFVCDQAGVNDTSVGHESQGSVHLAVIVSRRDAPQTVWVDGSPAKFDEREQHWFISSALGKPLRADGQTVSFRVPIPPDAQFLTLIASGAGDGVVWDHGVWLGARLELIDSVDAHPQRRSEVAP